MQLLFTLKCRIYFTIFGIVARSELQRFFIFFPLINMNTIRMLWGKTTVQQRHKYLSRKFEIVGKTDIKLSTIQLIQTGLAPMQYELEILYGKVVVYEIDWSVQYFSQLVGKWDGDKIDISAVCSLSPSSHFRFQYHHSIM